METTTTKKSKKAVQDANIETTTAGSSVQEKTTDAFYTIFSKADKTLMEPFKAALQNSTSPGHIYNVISVIERFGVLAGLSKEELGRAASTLRRMVSNRLNELKGTKAPSAATIDESYI